MGSVGKGIEKGVQFGGSLLGINPNTKLGKGGSFSMTKEGVAGEKEAIQSLRRQLSGKAPSISELQYQQGLEDILKQQQSATASARGVSNVGLLQREAMMQGQQAGLDIARESAAAKVAEQRGAQQALLNQAAAQRGVAQQAAASQLGAEQQASGTRAGFFGSLGSSAATAFSGGAKKAYGGEVEGEPKVKGDSFENDTEPHLLSPGEIVIPRSAAKDRESAMAFLDALKFEQEKKKPKKEESELKEPAKEQETDFHAMAKGMAALLQSMAEQHKKK
jgi:hypothetical protein